MYFRVDFGWYKSFDALHEYFNIALGIVIFLIIIHIAMSTSRTLFARGIVVIAIGVVLTLSIREIFEFAEEWALGSEIELETKFLTNAVESLAAAGFLFGAYRLFKLFSLTTVRDALTSSEREALESFIRDTTPSSQASRLAEQRPLFQELGIPLSRLAGKKVLIEFDPASNYEKCVKRLVQEALIDNFSVIILTKQGSNISSIEYAKIVLLSVSEQGLSLLPGGNLRVSMTNASILLEAFIRMLEFGSRYPGSLIIVDGLTDIILKLGFERAYNLFQQLEERLSASNAVMVLLLNLKAHEVKVRGIFEEYANILLATDGEGLRIIKG